MSGAQYLSGANGGVLVGYHVITALGTENLPTTTDGTYTVRTPVITLPVKKGDLVVCKLLYDYQVVAGASFTQETVSTGFTEQVPSPSSNWRSRLALNLGSSTKTSPGTGVASSDTVVAEVVAVMKESFTWGWGWIVFGARAGDVSAASIDNAKIEMWHYRPLVPAELRLDQFDGNSLNFPVEDTT